MRKCHSMLPKGEISTGLWGFSVFEGHLVVKTYHLDAS